MSRCPATSVSEWKYTVLDDQTESGIRRVERGTIEPVTQNQFAAVRRHRGRLREPSTRDEQMVLSWLRWRRTPAAMSVGGSTPLRMCVMMATVIERQNGSILSV